MTPKIKALSLTIRATPIDPTSFAPFGYVVQNPARHNGQPANIRSVVANQGSATKHIDVTSLIDYYGQAPSGQTSRPAISMFSCKTRQLRPSQTSNKALFDVAILERHPYTSQTFIPLGLSGEKNAAPSYLVIVAPTSSPRSSSPPPDSKTPKGPGDPDLSKLCAFLVRGDQAVTYGPGTWHAPMVALGSAVIDFVVVQFVNGTADEDCQEIEIVSTNGGHGLAVEIDSGDLPCAYATPKL